MIFIYVGLVGLCFGSFVNAWVWRLHKQEVEATKTKKRSAKTQSKYSILHGRSMCVHCRHTLAWYDLLPVVSWLGLRGKCRYCHKSISWQYPLVELSTAALFVISYVEFHPHLPSTIQYLQFFIWLVFVVSFMALIVYDLRWMLLPNKIVFPLTGLAVLHVLLEVVATDRPGMTLLSAIGGLLAIGGLFWVLFQVSDGKWIGGGDVKLGFVLGLVVGHPVQALLVIFLASVMGTLFALPQLVSKQLKVQSRIPFGPFLLIGTMVVYLWGQRMIDWYLNILV